MAQEILLLSPLILKEAGEWSFCNNSLEAAQNNAVLTLSGGYFSRSPESTAFS